jgi:ABC-type oligopeptide transport system ATPase subunit
MAVIKVKNISKNFGTLKAVDNLSFEVEAGQVFGFLGQNGSGKSTTIRMLLSLIHPSSGSIELFGKSIQKNRDTIDEQWSDLEQKTREFEEQERQWRDATLALVRLKTQIQQYETFLQPVQDHLDQIRQKLENISHWFIPMESNGIAYHYAINS